jgi:hypothetical protein
MRTSAEAHMYMDQQPCTCGDIEFDRQSAVMTDGGVLCSRYFGKCRTCGTMREFIFELPPTQLPVTNQVEFGGRDTSRLLDAGQWMAISEYYAKLEPGTPDDLDIARAAVEEVIKFLRNGVEGVPDTAFWTERGRAVRDREPGRFRAARLAAILDAYRKQLARYDLTQIALTWKHTGDAQVPYTADARSRRFTIRINDFPAEPMYTLIAEGRELQDLDDWPSAWVMPDPPQQLLDLLKPRKTEADPRVHRAMSAPRTQLQRLTRILEERGAPVRLVLRAVEAANEPSLYMEVSALSRRMTLLFPYRAEILEALAPGVSAGTLPSRPMLKLFVDGDQLHVALAAVGKVAPSEAVDVAPEPTRAAWVDVVSAMHGFADGRISSRIRFLTQPRSTIDVFYQARSQDADARFATSMDQVAWRLGVAPSQREMWKSVHSSMRGVAVTVTTVCTDGGPAPELAFTYGTADWDEAVRVCKLVASEDAARRGAAMLGMLAGTLEAEKMRSLQLVLRPGAPDVGALVMLK